MEVDRGALASSKDVLQFSPILIIPKFSPKPYSSHLVGRAGGKEFWCHTSKASFSDLRELESNSHEFASALPCPALALPCPALPCPALPGP